LIDFGDESLQSIICTGTDNLTRTTKRQNTQITQRKRWLSAPALACARPKATDKKANCFFSSKMSKKV